MSQEYPDFLRSFNSVEVPLTVVLQDAVEATALQLAYLENIQDSLQLSSRALSSFFEYETRLLIPATQEAALARGESGIMTDDYTRLFRQKGRQALASVTLIRDDFNYSIVHFAKYPLSEGSVESLRSIHVLNTREFDASN